MPLRPGSAAAQALYLTLDISRWKIALASYDSCVLAIQTEGNKNVKQLVSDDNFWRFDLSNKIDDKGFISGKELSRVVRWKLARGKWRPLQKMVDGNKNAEVVKASRNAFKSLSENLIDQALKDLCVLRGIGPATASAVLAAASPDRVPFLADEAYEAVPGFGQRKYTAKAFKEFRGALEGHAVKLSSLDDMKWSPELVGRALWAEAKISEGKGDYIDTTEKNNKQQQDENRNSPTKRKQAQMKKDRKSCNHTSVNEHPKKRGKHK